jgi:hypothetical protein
VSSALAVRAGVERSAITRHAVYNVLAIELILVVALQRVAVPFVGGQVSMTLPVVLLGMGYLFARGVLVEDAVRAGLFVVSIVLCLLAAIGALLAGLPVEMSSLLLFVVIYVPFVYVLAPQFHDLYPRLPELFCRFMVIAALLTLLQWAVQIAGGPYLDPLNSLPSEFLLHGYNTSYAVVYGSGITKSNGFFFLEPSFCSQFLALAALIQLARGGKIWRVVLFGLALLPTVSGTGLLLVAFGLIILAVRRGSRWSLAMGVVTALAVAVVAATPAGAPFASRADESKYADSSFTLRFVAPYERTFEALGSASSAPLVGIGAGGAQRISDEYIAYTGDAALAFSVPAKLITEYGLIAGFAFLFFTVATFLVRVPSVTIALMLLFVHVTLSGSLHQPFIVYLGLLLASLFAKPRQMPKPPLRSVEV